ncbi:MAG: DsbA family protein [Geminicoccaceae bacterium]|nr:DsbA family protein [Geminicoccaceae bacterium]HRY23475.1 DsbA family protein [Geminicoccaceae bacterium]
MRLELLYFANPMCSWCWGFAPAVQALAEAGHRITLAQGSLGADRARPMRPEDKASVRQHWEHVAERSGQPFDFGFFGRDGFVYDTEPACRAVEVVRRTFPALALPAFARLQERFYALGHDVTDPSLLRAAAAEFGIAPEAFDRGFAAAETADRVAAEWQQTARLGVTGYPTLLAFAGGRPEVVTIGWRPPEEVLAAVDALAGTGA